MYYIGSTTLDKINNGYFGSIKSKKWLEIFKKERKHNPHFFTIKIISTHKSRELALIAEYNLQKELDVVKSKDFFNESLANINGYFGRDVKGMSNPMFGRCSEVIAININTGEKVRVTKEEFDARIDLSGHTFGLLSVINNKGEKVNITKKEFNENRYKYKHFNEGRKHSIELKNKLSEIRIGFITAKDWDGYYHRVHKNDDRLKSGEFGNTTSKRWVIIDLEGNEYKTLNFKKFFNDNNLQYPRPENIINGVIVFKQKSKKKSTNGWLIKCLD